MSQVSRLEAIRQQVMWNRLVAVVEEQAQALLRTAFSPIVREAGDLSAGVFDVKGRMLAQAVTGTPGHVNSMAESVKHFLRHFPPETMQEGDVYLTNDPWMGSGHLNDFVATTPCFRSGRLAGLFCCTAHLTDIGGLGMGPDGTDVHMEGIYVPMTKLVDCGVFNETLISLVRANSRHPVEAEGDIYSLAACNDVGCKRLNEMMDEFGIDNLGPLADYICRSSQQAVERVIGELPNGVYRNAMTVDGYDRPIELVATLTIEDHHILVDYDGTSPTSRFGINVPINYTAAYTCFGLRCAMAHEVPNNAGSLAPYRVTAPECSILNAAYPAAVSVRHIIGQMLPDVVFGCLAQVIPDRVPAEGASCLWTINLRGSTGIQRRQAGIFTATAVTNGGTGARPKKDGMSATAYPSGVRGTPVEINEAVAPVIFWRKELRPDSGGVGALRGGLGQIIEIESALGLDFEILSAFDRIEHPARGRHGGGAGAPGTLTLASGKCLRGKGTQTIAAGERLIIHTPGGGGVGNPCQRDRSLVQADVANGFVSIEAAQSLYGYIAPLSATASLDEDAVDVLLGWDWWRGLSSW